MIKRACSLLGLAAIVLVALLTGCATGQQGAFPLSWNNVRPGMQRDQVHALLGAPAQGELGGPEEIYLYAQDKAHSELHVQYDASGIVCAMRYHYIE